MTAYDPTRTASAELAYRFRAEGVIPGDAVCYPGGVGHGAANAIEYLQWTELAEFAADPERRVRWPRPTAERAIDARQRLVSIFGGAGRGKAARD